VDKELATGEFFLRESVKKRKKMEAIKVSPQSHDAQPLSLWRRRLSDLLLFLRSNKQKL